MSNYKIGFLWIAVVIFLLPMFINIAYVVFPPANADSNTQATNKVLELIEQSTRILYFVSLVLIVSKKTISYKSPWLILAVVFLILYHIVWIRYFAGGRDIALMGKSFCGVPMPLAVFPVLYFIFAALWLHNYIACGFMIIFGIAHIVISYMSFH